MKNFVHIWISVDWLVGAVCHLLLPYHPNTYVCSWFSDRDRTQQHLCVVVRRRKKPKLKDLVIRHHYSRDFFFLINFFSRYFEEFCLFIFGLVWLVGDNNVQQTETTTTKIHNKPSPQWIMDNHHHHLALSSLSFCLLSMMIFLYLLWFIIITIHIYDYIEYTLLLFKFNSKKFNLTPTQIQNNNKV